MKRKLMLLLGIMIIIAAAGAIIIMLAKPREDMKVVSESNRLKVVTTFYPMYLIGLNVTDQVDDVEVKSLTKLNTGCLHDYQLTTEDMKIISEADIMVINGGGIEGFLKDVEENYPELTIIDASKGITMLNNNPHVWLDPRLYIKQIENVSDGIINYIKNNFSTEDDRNGSIQKIEQNTDDYITKVSELDKDLGESLGNPATAEGDTENVPKVVIFHDSFAYLADRLGIPIAFSVPLDSDTSLSAENIAEIIDDVRLENIKYLFTEQQYSDSIAKQIAAETDAKVYIINSVVTGENSKDAYLKAMRDNIEVLKKAINH